PSDARAHCSAFTTSKNSAEGCADCGADANRLSSALAARLADLLIVVTRERIRLALEVQAGQLQGQLTAAGHTASRARIDQLDEDVGAGRYDRFAIDHDGKGERSAEEIAGVIGSGIHA